MSRLVKLSLRNCNLQGPIPDLSLIPHLLFVDLSFNQLNGSIPPNKLAENITTVILSNNNLTGTIPSYFSDLPRLQTLSLANNSLDGSVPSSIWQNNISNAGKRLLLELQNNQFINISENTNLPPNVTLLLDGNPLCSDNTLNQFCKLEGAGSETNGTSPKNSSDPCPNQRSSKISMQIDGTRAFTYEELSAATSNFDNNAQIGQGGYGKVYKGILSNGTVVAIKRAQQGSLQGEKEFLTEIRILSRIHQRNLVSLIGYCDEEGEQMLVYEFMPNGTLRDHVSVTSEKPLTFAMRLKIALESAKGLMYLHTEADPPIFHRDVKSSNILLDSKFTAKIADFGLSRLAPVSDVHGVVPGHVSTVVKGTPGYLDPEYFLTHTLTDKSDVYSLGVVFLELLTGMHPIAHGKNIVREVNLAFESGEISSIIDKNMGSYPFEYAEKFLNLALKCCEDKPEPRPKMAEVVRILENMCSVMIDSNTMRDTSTSNDSRETVSLLGTSSSSTKKTPFVLRTV
ncbi:probable LRR receptor-like serine/threonine-protein kinase At1g06840 [Vicia villosa]|uniref:probable LRR receptor-like serine/threonine-protein kinase At1g06840 n=1 Tax=Vicia villosa TaxID=3911 RepID=UPI00273BBC2A|nr:probable LRR receptor-like serine/threonine-protein kinase At1g06840 [Vicia villosa]